MVKFEIHDPLLLFFNYSIKVQKCLIFMQFKYVPKPHISLGWLYNPYIIWSIPIIRWCFYFMFINYFVFFILSIVCNEALAAPPHSFPEAKRIVYQVFQSILKLYIVVVVLTQNIRLI